MPDNMELKDAATTGVSYGTVESTLVNRRKGAFKSVWDDDSDSDSEDEANDKDKKPRIRFVFRWSDLIIIVVYLVVSAIGLYFALSRMLPQAEKLRIAFYDTSIPVGPTPLLRLDAPPVVFARDPPCKQLAEDLLEQGGNAVDAVIGLSVCNVALRPQSWSLGGGLVILVYNRTTREARVIDGLSATPKNLSAEEFLTKQRRGLKEVETLGVPGALKGLELANKLFGKLAWHYKVDPVADLCENGFNVTDSLGRVLSGKSGDLWKHSNIRTQFEKEGGQLLGEGELLRRPALSDTLRRVAKLGAKEFYTGVIGKQMLIDIAAAGGLLTANDFEAYEARESSVANTSSGVGTWLVTSGPPSGGPALSLASSLLRTLGPLLRVQELDAQFRALVEIFKQSLTRRLDDMATYYDSGMASSATEGVIVEPTSDEGSTPLPLGDPGVPEAVATIDKEGDVAVIVSDLHGVFGSHFMSNMTGVIFNGALNEFPAPPPGGDSKAHSLYQPGARVPSPAAPALLVNDTGDVDVVFTADGPGNQTLTAAIQFLWRVLYTNATLKQAIDAPRLHHPLVPDILYAEYKFPGVVLQKLHTTGYTLETLRTNSSLMGLQRDVYNRTLLYNEDYRIVF
ncbi:scoloptoxin SSD14-like [Haemaphysalis longicornis]